MTIYQQELMRKLPLLGCIGQYNEDTDNVTIYLNNELLCEQDNHEYLIGNEDMSEERKAVCRDVLDQARYIREYVEKFESSPPMDIAGINEYRKMAEYVDIVLGGMYSEDYGFMFATWKLSKDRSSAFWGHYTPEYESAKQDFATRAGFVDESMIYTEKEISLLYACLDYTKSNCENLTYEQDEQIGALLEKIRDAYPQLEESPPSFEQEDAPQLNM